MTWFGVQDSSRPLAMCPSVKEGRQFDECSEVLVNLEDGINLRNLELHFRFD